MNKPKRINGFVQIEIDGLQHAIPWTPDTRIIWPEEMAELILYEMWPGNKSVPKPIEEATKKYLILLARARNMEVSDPGRQGYKASELVELGRAFAAGFQAAV